MELDFKELEIYLQSYLNGNGITEPDMVQVNGDEYINISLQDDLNKVSPAQRLGFIEKYLEFIEPKQLRRGTSTASGEKDFTLKEADASNTH